MAALAPVATLEAPCTLLGIEGLTICTQRLMLDDKATPDSVMILPSNSGHSFKRSFGLQTPLG